MNSPSRRQCATPAAVILAVLVGVMLPPTVAAGAQPVGRSTPARHRPEHARHGHASSRSTHLHTRHHPGSRLLSLSLASGPLRWGDCDAIPYFINPAGAPAHWADTVDDALAQAADVTGYAFRYAGTTTAGVTSSADGQSGTVDVHNAITFVWSDSQHSPYLPAEGGITFVASQGSVIRDVAVVLSSSLLRDRRAWVVPQVLLHEIGHAMGLGHAPDKNEIMYPTQSVAIDGYQSGDRAGLRQVGRAAGPCVAHDAPTGASPTPAAPPSASSPRSPDASSSPSFQDAVPLVTTAL